MPRKAKELTDIAVRNLRKPGYYAVGGAVSGLLLQVTATGARSWVLRYTAGVKPGTDKPWRRDLGLGGYPDVSLSEARRKAAEARELLSKNIDPITAKREARSAMLAARLAEITFEKAAHQFIESKSAEWKSGGKSADQWTSSLEAYAFPVLGSLRVADIDRAHVLRVLEPIWIEKNETANRVRQRMESVLDWAKVRGFREGDNPARWNGYLDKVLPAPGKVRDVQHHPALPYAPMQSFMLDLRSRNGMGARVLEFAILTAARSGEARGARWDEVGMPERCSRAWRHRFRGGGSHRRAHGGELVGPVPGGWRSREPGEERPARPALRAVEAVDGQRRVLRGVAVLVLAGDRPEPAARFAYP
ncbi:integrase arm-type DNA-binding domain-containing protein [Xanthomonas sp. GPE 39]|uniref:tyrosine-type recombinase/integrase n=1 Tax=Xanthomonas sp. GPE 39 TaxID=1583099 RepID=UPI0009E5D1F9|nr:integrase arm-type DNA-binding domain-containing protein [Xanthomonas sp. GPE 39]